MSPEWSDEGSSDNFDKRVRALRPRPTDALIELVNESAQRQRNAGNMRRPLRVGLGIAAAAVLAFAFAVSGGPGYASSAVKQGVQQAESVVAPGAQTISDSPADTQYRPGKGCGDMNHIHDRRFECQISINDVTVKEGNSGTSPAIFIVSLGGIAIDAVTVDFTTGNGSATAPSDYLPSTGTVTFAPGESSKTVTVSVGGDNVREPNEIFYVNLSNTSTNAVIGDGQGAGTIKNDD